MFRVARSGVEEHASVFCPVTTQAFDDMVHLVHLTSEEYMMYTSSIFAVAIETVTAPMR